ncbi:MAG: MBL fold metallo-hydrolase RNA specificity domain-containing protein [Planctomycetota bacterium]|jgi:metallo-beta-lactamase family protein
MELRVLGAAGTTTGSMHLLQIGGKRILLECGLYQGKRKEAFERNRNLPLDCRSLDACVLSHAHIDHSGNLPSLVKNGYQGPIIATPATRDLCEIMLADAAYLQVQDVSYVNKGRVRQGKNPFEPLYTPEDIPPTLGAFSQLPYGQQLEVVPGVTLTFHDAGHILGSAFVQLDITENGSSGRLFFTGDVGRNNMPILRDPHVLHDVDFLITESTYGNRLHPSREDVKAKLVELCGQIVRDRARLVIPAFSVGRTQQLVYFLNELVNEGEVQDLPVFVDSPLSTKATGVYEKHSECYDEETNELLRRGDNPFWFPGLTYTADVEESKKLNDMAGPVVIISASGMCEGGRILHHLKHTVEDERNAILIVGYQAQHTLGRRLVEGVSPIKIYGERHDLRAQVHTINALSAHADHDELVAYFTAMGPKVDRAFVVHGEAEASGQLAGDLHELGAQNVVVPGPGDSYEL